MSKLDETLLKAGVPKGIHRTGFDPEDRNRVCEIDTLTEAKQAIKDLFLELVGEDDTWEEPKDMADHWGLTETAIERMLTNGKNLGKNELRAELRQKIENL